MLAVMTMSHLPFATAAEPLLAAGLKLRQAAEDTAHPDACCLHYKVQACFLGERVAGFLSIKIKFVFLCQDVQHFCITEGFFVEVHSKTLQCEV